MHIPTPINTPPLPYTLHASPKHPQTHTCLLARISPIPTPNPLITLGPTNRQLKDAVVNNNSACIVSSGCVLYTGSLGIPNNSTCCSNSTLGAYLAIALVGALVVVGGAVVGGLVLLWVCACSCALVSRVPRSRAVVGCWLVDDVDGGAAGPPRRPDKTVHVQARG